MAHLSFADLIRHRVPLSAPEAVALTLAVSGVLDNRRSPGAAMHVPGDDRLLLSNTGEVTFGRVESSTEEEEISGLAALLRRLLQLDTSGAGERRGRVPGALLVVLAQSLGQIDLAPPSRHDFLTALIRFAGNHQRSAAALSVIFWRAAALRPGVHAQRTPIALLTARAGMRTERRTHGLSRDDLRRALREMEREAFERAAAEPTVTEATGPRRAVAATALIATLVAGLIGTGAAKTRSPDATPLPLPHARGGVASAVSGPRLAPYGECRPPVIRTSTF